MDLTRPGYPTTLGSRHPVSLTLNRIIEIFTKIGFTVEENREIEDEWHNFTALNTPEDHPARDMTDTYYLANDFTRMLRSQTSTVQVHVMESQNLLSALFLRDAFIVTKQSLPAPTASFIK